MNLLFRGRVGANFRFLNTVLTHFDSFAQFQRGLFLKFFEKQKRSRISDGCFPTKMPDPMPYTSGRQRGRISCPLVIVAVSLLCHTTRFYSGSRVTDCARGVLGVCGVSRSNDERTSAGPIAASFLTARVILARFLSRRRSAPACILLPTKVFAASTARAGTSIN